MELATCNISPIFFYLVYCGQLLAVGREGDQASSQVDQAADLQVRVGAAGGRRIDGIPHTHHVAIAPLDTAEKYTALQNWKERHILWSPYARSSLPLTLILFFRG